MNQTRTEYLIGPNGGPSKEVQVTRRKVRVTPHSQPQELFTDPKSKKTKLLPKKKLLVTIR
jgi:hypothetical protein